MSNAGTLVHTYNTSYSEAGAGGLWLWANPGQFCMTLSQNKKGYDVAQ